jgi:LPS-assembly protein
MHTSLRCARGGRKSLNNGACYEIFAALNIASASGIPGWRTAKSRTAGVFRDPTVSKTQYVSALSRICHRHGTGDPFTPCLLVAALALPSVAAAAGNWQCVPGPDGGWMCEPAATSTIAPGAAQADDAVRAADEMPAESSLDVPASTTEEIVGDRPTPAAASAADPTAATTHSARAAAARTSDGIAPPAAGAVATSQVSTDSDEAKPKTVPAEPVAPAAATAVAEPPAAVEAPPYIAATPPAMTDNAALDAERPLPAPPAAAETPAVPHAVEADIDAGIAAQACGPASGLPVAAETGGAPTPGQPIIVDADSMVAASRSEVVQLVGDVEVRQGDISLRADRVELDRLTGAVDAFGNVLALGPDLRIGGSAAHYQLAQRTGRVEDVVYRVPAMGARGSAEYAELEPGRRSRFRDISYTTCRPGNDDWLLTADALALDHAEGLGTADGARLSFLGAPLLYLPTLTFPIDDRRRSGFLIPSAGYSNSHGLELAVPYYFNLAPNYDFTFSPRILSKRGVLLGGQLRYLSEQSQGQVDAELMPTDADYNGDNAVRGAFDVYHTTRFDSRTRADVRAGYVSDRDYLADLGGNLASTSATHVEQLAEMHYAADTWTLLGRVQNHQTLDAAIPRSQRPYARLPQVRLDLLDDGGLAGTTYHLGAEFTHFQRDTGVRGQRVDLFPAISLPLRRSWGYLVPKAGARYIGYDLTHQAAGLDDSPSTASTVLSLDGGLYFDRSAGYFGRDALHTLEPRLFYLHVPDHDQADQPVFDSGLLDFGFDRLFRENRFSGADRLGDANQLTLALTSRHRALDTGEELLRASIGQILYFDDLDVTLPGQARITDASSPVVGEISARLGAGWRATAGLEWDPHRGSGGNIDQSLAQVSYRGAEGRAFNAAYRLRDNEIEQTDLAAVWPLGERFSLVARHNYSLRDDRLLEGVAGFEYRRCCWRFRTLLHSYSNGTADDQSLGVLFQLELNGLGRLGDDIESILERSIYAYR